MNKKLFFACYIFLLLILTSCAQRKNSIFGKYVIISDKEKYADTYDMSVEELQKNYYIALEPDDICYFVFPGDELEAAAWSLDGNEITFTSGGETIKGKLENNILTINPYGTESRYEFSEPFDSKAAAGREVYKLYSINGREISELAKKYPNDYNENDLVITLYPDGKMNMIFDGRVEKDASWEKDGNNLTLYFDGDKFRGTLSDDVMTLNISIQEFTLKKVSQAK